MRVVGDRYEVRELLGRGGMGVVHRAFDRRLARAVALKELAPGVAPEAGLRARFVREAAALAKVRHPNVVAILDTGVEDATPWLVMELCAGGSLADRLSKGSLPIGEARRIASDVLDGLAAVHAAGLIHRDLKPENILRDAGRWLVSDFGIVRDETGTSTQLTETGFLIGTPEYWAPEFMEEWVSPSAASDMYALGCVLFEAVTGSPPFRGDNRLRVAMMHATQPTPAIPEPVRVADPALAALIAACLGKDPASRPSAAAGAEQIGRSVRPATLMVSAAGAPAAPGGAPEVVETVEATTVGPDADRAQVPALAIAPRRLGTRARIVAASVAVVSLVAVAGVAVAVLGGRSAPPEAARSAGSAAAATPPAPRPTVMRLPDLAGTTQVQARTQLAAVAAEAGLRAPRLVRRATRYSDARTRGRIIAQTPPPGRQVAAGEEVAVIVSRGARTVSVPSTNGTADAVATRLRAMDLEPEITYASSFEVPQGEVIRADPATGESVRRPARVSLAVSSGWRSDAIVIVDDVTIAGWPTGAGGGRDSGRLSTAETVFGDPVSRSYVDGVGCDVAWSGDVGMRGYFYNLGGQDPCGPFGFMSEMVMTGPRFVTDRGLAIGSPLSKLQALYPDAYPTDSTTGEADYVLFEQFTPIADGGYFASLRATVSGGVVMGFVLNYPGGGD